MLTFVILIFGEVTPKTLATLHPERLAYPAAYVYQPLLKVLYPLVWLVNLFANGLLRLMGVATESGHGTALSREELRTVVSESGAMIPERSRSMLLAILDLERATVEDIMIPRNEVAGIDIQDSEDEIIAVHPQCRLHPAAALRRRYRQPDRRLPLTPRPARHARPRARQGAPARHRPGRPISSRRARRSTNNY